MTRPVIRSWTPPAPPALPARIAASLRRQRGVPGEIEELRAAVEELRAALGAAVNELAPLRARVEELERTLSGGFAPASETARLDLAFAQLAATAPASEVERLDLAFEETTALREALHRRTLELLALTLSERTVEIPFVLSQYHGEARVLEIGFAHAEPRYVEALQSLEIPLLVGLDLVPGNQKLAQVFSPVVGDVRTSLFRAGAFDLVLLVSTVEHVGRDNSGYGIDRDGASIDEHPDRSAIATIARWLAPGGRLLVTVPFGRFEDHGWLVNYDAAHLDALVAASGLDVASARYYEQRGGWVPCDRDEVRNRGYGSLGVPNAGAVALLELAKSPPSDHRRKPS